MSDTLTAPATEQEVDEVAAAIRDLPPDTHERVERGLARVAIDYKKSGKVDLLLSFVRSLLTTAQMHRNPRYRKAYKEARTERIGAGRDVADIINEIKRQKQF